MWDEENYLQEKKDEGGIVDDSLWEKELRLKKSSIFSNDVNSGFKFVYLVKLDECSLKCSVSDQILSAIKASQQLKTVLKKNKLTHREDMAGKTISQGLTWEEELALLVRIRGGEEEINQVDLTWQRAFLRPSLWEDARWGDPTLGPYPTDTREMTEEDMDVRSERGIEDGDDVRRQQESINPENDWNQNALDVFRHEQEEAEREDSEKDTNNNERQDYLAQNHTVLFAHTYVSEERIRGQPSMSYWDPACKVYIGGLRDDANKYDIEDAFSRYGTVRNVWVARKPPGFAFVEMDDSRDAEDLESLRTSSPLGLGLPAVIINAKHFPIYIYEKRIARRKYFIEPFPSQLRKWGLYIK